MTAPRRATTTAHIFHNEVGDNEVGHIEVGVDPLEAAILELLSQRGSDKSICPSEVARAVRPRAWRATMQSVRDAAERLARRGAIEVTQRGERVSAKAAGPIRLRLPSSR